MGPESSPGDQVLGVSADHQGMVKRWLGRMLRKTVSTTRRRIIVASTVVVVALIGLLMPATPTNADFCVKDDDGHRYGYKVVNDEVELCEEPKTVRLIEALLGS